MPQSADRDLGTRRLDGHATAIAVLQAHHAVHIRIQGQEFTLDPLDGNFQNTGHALHRGGNSQQIACAHRTVGIHVAFKGEAIQRFVHRRLHRGHGQVLQFTCSRHVEQALVHPTARRNVLPRITYRHVVAHDGLARGQIDQGQFVTLRHLVAQDHAFGHAWGHDGAGR